MALPEVPNRGVKIKPWLKKLYYHVKSLDVQGDGKTCRVSSTPGGKIIHVIPRRLITEGGETSGELIIGVVVSATPQGGPATIAEITLNADGTFQETGVQYQVIIPRV